MDEQTRGAAQRFPSGDAAPVRIAAFDLDGTLLDGQSGTLVVRYLIARGMLPKAAVAACTWWGVRYKLHLPHRQAEVREIIFRSLRDMDPDRVASVMREFHAAVMVPRYRAAGIRELRRMAEQGMHTVIVSATFDAIAQESRSYVGADCALATLMQRGPDGRYTGYVDGRVTEGGEKLRRMNAYADGKFGPGGWVLARAYGDHYTDVALLEQAQERFVVDPGPTMRREAERRGWPQLEW